MSLRLEDLSAHSAEEKVQILWANYIEQCDLVTTFEEAFNEASTRELTMKKTMLHWKRRAEEAENMAKNLQEMISIQQQQLQEQESASPQ